VPELQAAVRLEVWVWSAIGYKDVRLGTEAQPQPAGNATIPCLLFGYLLAFDWNAAVRLAVQGDTIAVGRE